jgi:hypothetical protein
VIASAVTSRVIRISSKYLGSPLALSLCIKIPTNFAPEGGSNFVGPYFCHEDGIASSFTGV